MPVTVLGPAGNQFPEQVLPPIVEVKQNWSDQWQWVAELQPIRATWCASGHDLGMCSLRRRYGAIKLPWETQPSAKPAWSSGAGWWVRLSLLGPNGPQPYWIGQLSNEDRDMHGSTAHGPSGVQNFVGYGPLQNPTEDRPEPVLVARRRQRR